MKDNSMPAQKTVSDEAILRQFDRSADPVLTATEVAEGLTLTKDTVNYRLNRLLEDGKVGKKKVGARAVAWWRRD